MKNQPIIFLVWICFIFSSISLTSQNNIIDFDGVDDYMEIPNSPDINFDTNDDFTVEVWLRVPIGNQRDRDVGDNDVIEKWDQGSGSYPFVIRYLNINAGIHYGKISAARYAAPQNPGILSTVTINDGLWHHIAFVKDGGTLYLYIDGVLDGSAPDTTTGSTQNNSSLFIARRGCCGFDNFWRGSMDELRIWNDARTVTEINNNMNLELTGSEPNLTAYYNFNVGLCAEDNTGLIAPEIPDLASGNDATMNDMSKIGCTSNLICNNNLPQACGGLCTEDEMNRRSGWADGLVSYWKFDNDENDFQSQNNGSVVGGSGFSYINGQFGQAIDLDGTNTYVEVPHSSSLNFIGKSITISAWFRVDDFTDFWQALIGKGEGNNFRIHRFSNSDRIAYNGGAPDISDLNSINDGQYHHVVAVTEFGVRKTLYIDGQPVVTTAGNPSISDNGNPLLIGNNPDVLSRVWNGVIDDVAIWERALTSDEIKTLNCSGLSLEELIQRRTIPTLSEWGLMILALLLLIFGVVSVRQKYFILE